MFVIVTETGQILTSESNANVFVKCKQSNNVTVQVRLDFHVAQRLQVIVEIVVWQIHSTGYRRKDRIALRSEIRFTLKLSLRFRSRKLVIDHTIFLLEDHLEPPVTVE